MNETIGSGPTLYVRAAATWTADDGAPRSEALGRMRGDTTRLGRMAAAVVAGLPTLAELRRTRSAWVVASATGPLDGIVAALRSPNAALRPEAILPDGPANELAARLRGLQPWATVAAAGHTVAMGLIEAAAWLSTGSEDVVLVVSEAEVPASLQPAVRYEPLAVALHLAADPGTSDLAVIAGPDIVRVQPPTPTGPHAGSPGLPALQLARAALQGRAATVVLDVGSPPQTPSAGQTSAADAALPTVWSARIKPVDQAVA